MPHTRLREALPRARDIAWLGTVRALAGMAAYLSGFRALSDDEYARISIAQRFAEAPSLDPSGTSWLPLPFWVYGSALRVFGTDLAVARATAIALGITATLVVYVAARVLGGSRPGGLLAAALSALVPYSALLGIAAVPEVPCAALILLGAATLAREEPELRVVGGLALSAACLSRYEAWPVAATFAVFSVWGARKHWQLAVGGAIALLGPALWLFLGHAEHGDALFFVTRVASYRRALGPAAAGPLALRLLEYPGLLVRAEPELCGLLLAVLGVAWRVWDRDQLGAYRRAALALAALLLFLIFGSVRDGVPTHHAARVLLPLWFFACAVCGHGLAQIMARTSGRSRTALLAVAAAATLIGLLARPYLLPKEQFAERQLELAAGREAKRRGVSRLAIDTIDYGYLAVQAAFGSQTRSLALDDRDPRHPRRADPFLSQAGIARALRESGARFLVATSEHAAAVRPQCSELWQNLGFGLFECPASASTSAGPP